MSVTSNETMYLVVTNNHMGEKGIQMRYLVVWYVECVARSSCGRRRSPCLPPASGEKLQGTRRSPCLTPSNQSLRPSACKLRSLFPFSFEALGGFPVVTVMLCCLRSELAVGLSLPSMRPDPRESSSLLCMTA